MIDNEVHFNVRFGEFIDMDRPAYEHAVGLATEALKVAEETAGNLSILREDAAKGLEEISKELSGLEESTTKSIENIGPVTRSIGDNSIVFNECSKNVAKGEYASAHGKSNSCYNDIDESVQIYYKHISDDIKVIPGAKYNFEDLIFTTNPENALPLPEKIYYYFDEWGNKCYTLWEDLNEYIDISDKLFAEGSISGDTYSVVFSDEYRASSVAYAKLLEYIGMEGSLDYDEWNELDIYIEEHVGYTDHDGGYYEFHSLPAYPDTNGSCIFTLRDTGSSHYTLNWKNIDGISVYRVVKDDELDELEVESLDPDADNPDPIFASIRYEALVNGGQKFSLADGLAATTFGVDSITNGEGALASGITSLATANYALAIGRKVLARGNGAVALGLGGKATGRYSFAVNEKGIASGYASAVFGDHCQSTNYYSISGGYRSISRGSSALAIGTHCEALGNHSVAFGDRARATNMNAFAFGMSTEANGKNSFSVGGENKANGDYSIALGFGNTVDGAGAAIGMQNTVSANGFAYGTGNTVTGKNGSAAIGNSNNVRAINGSVAIGERNTVDADSSAYAIGIFCESSQKGAVALGDHAKAKGQSSVAIGLQAEAIGRNSVAIGRYAKATEDYQTVLGRANDYESVTDALLVVGNGMYDDQRSNAMVLYKNGRMSLGTVECSGDKDVTTKYYVDAQDNYYLNLAKSHTTTSMNSAKSYAAVLVSSIKSIDGGCEQENTVYGTGSVAIGRVNTVGSSSQPSNFGCVAIGNNNKLYGKSGSVVIGEGCEVTAESAYAIGLDCKSSARGAISLGHTSEAQGEGSVAAGYKAITYGKHAVSLGRCTVANEFQVALGRHNALVSGALLMVGNSWSASDPSNAMVLYNNGRLEIGADPTNAMDVVTKQYLETYVASIIKTLAQ